MCALPHFPPDPRTDVYERLLDEFAGLQEDVLAREVERMELEATLHAFEAWYLGRVQHLHALLDALHLETVELWCARERRLAPDPREDLDDLLEEARDRARASADALPEDPPEDPPRAEPPAEAARLYRQVARRVHPDLAGSEAQARVRHAFMSELNAAWKAGDVGRMQAVQDAWDAAATAPDEDLEEAIRRLERQIDRARRRLAELEAALADLRAGDLHALHRRVTEAEARGRDLVQEIVDDLERQIHEARLDLARQREEAAA